MADWLGASEAAEALGCSKVQLGRLAKDGRLQRRQAEDTGTWEYDVETYRDPEPATDKTLRGAAAVAEASGGVVAGLVGQLLSTHKDMIALVKAIGEESTRMMQALSAENASLRERELKNQDVIVRYLVAREKLLDRSSEREQAVKTEDARQRRIDELTKPILEVLPAMLAGGAELLAQQLFKPGEDVPSEPEKTTQTVEADGKTVEEPPPDTVR